MIEILWENPRFELPTVINLSEYPDLTVGEIPVSYTHLTLPTIYSV